MSMTGEVVDAARAERIGLVTEIVAHDGWWNGALALAASVAEAPAEAMRELKRMYVETGGLAEYLATEVAIARGYRPDYAGIEDRPAQVIGRNRAQLPREDH
jgi:enoyl-CoA hydratase/carnithine racemase